jgi:hypothetical protein
LELSLATRGWTSWYILQYTVYSAVYSRVHHTSYIIHQSSTSKFYIIVLHHSSTSYIIHHTSYITHRTSHITHHGGVKVGIQSPDMATSRCRHTGQFWCLFGHYYCFCCLSFVRSCHACLSPLHPTTPTLTQRSASPDSKQTPSDPKRPQATPITVRLGRLRAC